MKGITHGLMAKFESERALLRAIRELGKSGPWRLEASLPFESEEVLAALGDRHSKVPWIAFGAAVSSGFAAWCILWWTRTTSLPLDIGARPNDSSWADIPIIFESTILGTSLFAFVAMFLASGMPKLRHPWFEVPGFSPSSGFWLAVEAPDPGAERLARSKLEALDPLEIAPLFDPDAPAEEEA